MDLLDHRGRLIPRPGMGFIPSTPSPQARPAIADASDEVLSPAIGFEIEPDEETEPYEDDDDDIDEEDHRAPVRVVARHRQIHFGNGDGQKEGRQVLKGDRRKKTALAQLIRALAARIHDADALYAIANAIPAERRAHFIRSIKPLLKFPLPE